MMRNKAAKVLVMRDVKPESEEELQSWLIARKTKVVGATQGAGCCSTKEKQLYFSKRGAVNVAELYGDQGLTRRLKVLKILSSRRACPHLRGFGR